MPLFQKSRRLLMVLGTLAICLGATSESCSLRDRLKDKSNDVSFSTTLSLNDSGGSPTDVFNQGDPIEFELRVRNRDDNSATVDFDTNQQYDFVVVRAGTNDVVWQWSKHQPAPAQTPTTLEFAANQTKTFTFDWDQTDDNGNLLDRDDYEARGVLIFDGFENDPLQEDQFGSPLERFTVE
jgi:hypothetical protein